MGTRQADDWYQTLAEASPDIIFVVDREFCVLYVNSFAARLFHTSPRSIIGKPIEKFFAGEVLDRHLESINSVINTKTPLHTFSRSKFGSLALWIDTWLAPLFDDENNVYAVVGVSRDATNRKNTEEALMQEKEKFKVTLEGIGDGVVTTDRDGRIILINHVAAELCGTTPEEAMGKQVEQICRIESTDRDIPYLYLVPLILREKKTINLYNELVLTGSGGVRHMVSHSGSPLFDSQKTVIGTVLVFRDITERLKAEEEMIRSERLDSIGILAGGIGHDFNNILTGVLGNISLMKHVIKNPEELGEIIGQVEKAALQAKDLTRQLLTFSKGGEPIKTAASIRELVTDTVRFILSGSSVAVRYDLAENLPPVDIDKAQISQVIQNIVINAKQAMDDRGELVITGQPFVSEGTSPSLRMGVTYLKISIIDTGPGIPHHLQKKVFDPFFTTKENGSGLGLAISYSIIQRHQGVISIQSEDGKGTSVTIYLPTAAQNPEKQAEIRFLASGEGKRVLLIDDEEIVRQTSSGLISSLGYQVLTAPTGRTGIDEYKKARASTTPFDIVIIDLTMKGGLSGCDVINALKEMDPDVRSIVSSGYSDNTVMANYKKYGFRGMLEKPYTLQELNDVLVKVRR